MLKLERMEARLFSHFILKFITVPVSVARSGEEFFDQCKSFSSVAFESMLK
jgi:hypothetical protein